MPALVVPGGSVTIFPHAPNAKAAATTRTPNQRSMSTSRSLDATARVVAPATVASLVLPTISALLLAATFPKVNAAWLGLVALTLGNVAASSKAEMVGKTSEATVAGATTRAVASSEREVDMLRWFGVLVVAAALALGACGKIVTLPPGTTSAGIPSGYMLVRFRTSAPMNFQKYQYLIVFNTSGTGGTPYANAVFTGSYQNFTFAFDVSGMTNAL